MTEPGTPPSHLVTSLGTGKYEATRYYVAHDPERTVYTRYVAHAISELFEVDAVTVIATDRARETHEVDLKEAMGGRRVRFVQIPDGNDEGELWEQFSKIDEVFRSVSGPLLVDITHGYRAQPFFAGGVLALHRATGALDGRDPRILYGRYLQAAPEMSPIWDLSALLEALDWARGANLFVHGGSAHQLADILARRDTEIRARVKGAVPETAKLARALVEFADDYAALRVHDLVTRSAPRLREALRQYQDAATARLPVLGPIVGRLAEIARELSAERLHSDGGRRALLSLARRYREQERLVEALAVAREALVSLYASSPEAAEPGETHDPCARVQAETLLRAAHGTQGSPLATDLRNDVVHCGFRKNPRPGARIRENVDRVLEELEEEMRRRRERQGPDAAPEGGGRTWVVSRHPGAVEWLEQRGVHGDRVVPHLELDEVRPGDTVVGTLPVHLAAEVVAKGARYLHLALDVPSQARGRELSAEELERRGARLLAVKALKMDEPEGCG